MKPTALAGGEGRSARRAIIFFADPRSAAMGFSRKRARPWRRHFSAMAGAAPGGTQAKTPSGSLADSILSRSSKKGALIPMPWTVFLAESFSSMSPTRWTSSMFLNIDR